MSVEYDGQGVTQTSAPITDPANDGLTSQIVVSIIVALLVKWIF